MNWIDLDANATTPLLPAVWEAMRPLALEAHGNPASAHRLGSRARRALENAREKIAGLLAADPDEVIFTSGATEANNLAVFGLTGAASAHVIASPIEHPSVAEPVRELGRRGFRVDSPPIEPSGHLDPHAMARVLHENTRLIAAMLVNHETGAIQDIKTLADATSGRVPIHCDAVQAIGKIPVLFHDLGVSTLSLSAHKFHGPVGIGVLLVRRGVTLRPLFYGGHQQQGVRPGTESVALIVGMATALEISQEGMTVRQQKVQALRERLLAGLREHHVEFVMNSPDCSEESPGVPHTLNLSFPGCQADALLISLDLVGIACSTGSACSSGSLLPSPVLEAMGIRDDRLTSAMRFSFSSLLDEADVTEAARRIGRTVARLRSIGTAIAELAEA